MDTLPARRQIARHHFARAHAEVNPCGHADQGGTHRVDRTKR